MIPEGKTRVALTLNDEDVRRVDEWCERNGMTRSGFFTYLCKVAFDASELVPDVLAEVMTKAAVRTAVDAEIAARMSVLDEAYRAVGMA